MLLLLYFSTETHRVVIILKLAKNKGSAGAAQGQHSCLAPGPATLSLGVVGWEAVRAHHHPQLPESFLAGPQPQGCWGGGCPHPHSGHHQRRPPARDLGEQPFWSSATPSSERGPRWLAPGSGVGGPPANAEGRLGHAGWGVPTAERAPTHPEHTKQIIFTSTEPESLTAKRDLWSSCCRIYI